MRLLILTSHDHVYANFLLKGLIRKYGDAIVGIVESEVLFPNKSFAEALKKYLKSAGLWYVAAQGIKQKYFKYRVIFNSLFNRKNTSGIFDAYQRLAAEHNIPIISSADVNSAQFIRQTRELKPTLIASVLFNQILKSELLGLPDWGSINIHPALLPAYRGVSPAFWVLANSETRTGVTVHSIDEGIDTGQILAQKEIEILPEDSEHTLYMRCCREGLPLLIDSINEIQKTEKVEARVDRRLTTTGIKSSYFSLPTHEAVIRYRKSGRKFFRFCEFKSGEF
jgi:methionyl-tRNA formyltransferase